MAGTRAYLSSCRCHLRKRRVPAVANGTGHHTVYAHAGQYSPQKQSRSTVPSVFLIFPKATATSVPQGSNSTMVDTMLGTVPTSTSGPANVVGRARKKRNAPAHR